MSTPVPDIGDAGPGNTTKQMGELQNNHQSLKKDVTFEDVYDSSIFQCEEHPDDIVDSIEEKACKYKMDPR